MSDFQLGPMARCPFGYNVGYCEYQCVKDYYWHNFNCILNGTDANRCHQMKIVRKLYEKHRANISSIATIVTANKLAELKSSLYGFPTAANKSKALMNFIYQLSFGHELLIVANCKEECRIGEALPFCNSWEIVLEQADSEETIRDVENASKEQVHDINVHLDFKTTRSMLVYEEVPMLSLDNFVGQLGGLIGLYIGWSFLSVGMFAVLRLTKWRVAQESDVVLSHTQIEDMTNTLYEKIQKRIDERKS